MEKIIQYELSPQTERYPLSVRVFPVRYIAFGLVMGFTILILCTRGLARNTLPPSSPFASFADIFPGQPDDSIKARGFFCIMSPDRSDEHCVLKLETGSISEVRVLIAQHLIRQIQFTLREDLFKLGDLMLFLGTPNGRQNGHTINFVWPGSGIYATADSATRLFSPLIPLSMVSFTNRCLPDFESLQTCLVTGA